MLVGVKSRVRGSDRKDRTRPLCTARCGGSRRRELFNIDYAYAIQTLADSVKCAARHHDAAL